MIMTEEYRRILELVITQNSPWGMVTYKSFPKER